MRISDMQKISCTLMLGIGMMSSAVLAQESGKVFATVNGEEITESMVEIAEEQIGQSFSQVPNEEQREVIVGILVDLMVLAQEARKDGLDKTDEFKQKLNFLEVQALRDVYFANNINSLVTDEDVKAKYDENYSESSGEMEVDASHILVETEDEAKEIIELLDGGQDFAELAKEKSTGPSGPNGGKLGFFGKNRMVKPFETAAFDLEVDAYTKEPVETQFGWHIIKVHEKREKPAPPFEQVEQQLRQELIRDKYAEVINGLKSSADIVMNEDGG